MYSPTVHLRLCSDSLNFSSLDLRLKVFTGSKLQSHLKCGTINMLIEILVPVKIKELGSSESVLANEPFGVKSGQDMVEVKPQDENGNSLEYEQLGVVCIVSHFGFLRNAKVV
ncbi:hypothetical protein CTI12_AA166780 [Artemisia annua]|uniref:Uncharacterized protein n=1 Tax=Artemisia annua TaxID=35608 RepID=A0A2U1MWV6_ARTAN|nr:hypothetical protein CTI12_AA166780 [Artemisia annua]